MSRKTKLTLGRQDDDAFIPSTHPSTEDDVRDLDQRFNIQLHKEFALECGFCPKRRRIYDDLFDELIRITKIHCSERGQLLESVKNEYQQWINTYEELYSSGMGYGMRQYLVRNEEKKNLEAQIHKLETECEQLRGELEQESIKYRKVAKLVEKNNREDKELEVLRNNVTFLREVNQKVKRDLEDALSSILSSTIFLGESANYEKKA